MADAYARTTGEVGVCTLTHGPGLTNGVTGLASADRDNVPVVVIVGDTSIAGRETSLQYLDHLGMTEAVSVYGVRAETVETLPGTLRRAFAKARERSGPVVVEVPSDVQAGRAPDEPYEPKRYEDDRVRPDPRRVAEAAELLDTAENPLILAGGGAAASGAGGAIATLAERLGAPVATTFYAKGLLPDHPLCTGIAGTFMTPASADLAVVTVKAGDTETAAAALANCDLDACLSLQNGMGNEAALAAELSCPVLAGTCTYGARLAGPGKVECTGIGEVVLGPRGGGQSALADRVGRAFAEGEIETTVADDMPRRLWEKLAVNCAINATTALARVPNGALVDGPAAAVAERAAREAATVAREQGIDLSGDDAAAAALGVAEDTARNTSSMRQDVEAGRQTEIDAINGYVVAQSGDVDVPVNRTLAALVRAWEAR